MQNDIQQYKKLQELKQMSTQLVGFLRENYDPHHEIIINFDTVRLVNDVMSTNIEI